MNTRSNFPDAWSFALLNAFRSSANSKLVFKESLKLPTAGTSTLLPKLRLIPNLVSVELVCVVSEL